MTSGNTVPVALLSLTALTLTIAAQPAVASTAPQPAPRSVPATGPEHGLARQTRALPERIAFEPAGTEHTVARPLTRAGRAMAGPKGPNPASWRCAGTGASTNRVQLMYIHAEGAKDRFEEVKDQLRYYAGEANEFYLAGARQQGGYREIRYVTDHGKPGCQVDIARVTVTADQIKSFNGTVDALRAKGHNRKDRKYVGFVDSQGVYCGLGGMYVDARPGPENSNNSGDTFALVENNCWMGMAHELMHSLGAVNIEAPHATKGSHCTDGHELMCYDDGTPQKNVCPESNKWIPDCNHDDYFSVAPKKGSWLASHWNTADNVFLYRKAVEAA